MYERCFFFTLCQLCQHYPSKVEPKIIQGTRPKTGSLKSHRCIYWKRRLLGCANQMEKQGLSEGKSMGMIITATQCVIIWAFDSDTIILYLLGDNLKY